MGLRRIRRLFEGIGILASGRDLPPRGDPRADQRGQGMVEYALVLLFIAIVVIAIISILGHQVSNVFSNVSSAFH